MMGTETRRRRQHTLVWSRARERRFGIRHHEVKTFTVLALQFLVEHIATPAIR